MAIAYDRIDFIEYDTNIRGPFVWGTRRSYRSPKERQRKPVQCRASATNSLRRTRPHTETHTVSGRDCVCVCIHSLFPNDILPRRGSRRKLRRGLHDIHTCRHAGVANRIGGHAVLSLSCFLMKRRVRLHGYVRSGSKGEILTASRCFPLCPPQRT